MVHTFTCSPRRYNVKTFHNLTDSLMKVLIPLLLLNRAKKGCKKWIMLEHLKMSTFRTGLNSFLTSELAWFKSVSILNPEIEKQEARTAKLSIH